MFVRKTLTGVVVAALAGSALALGQAPAFAADPDDTTFSPVAADLIGVGSDTSQHALKLLADSWNASGPASRLASFAATGGGQITLPSGAINRPNGSGAGKGLLYGAGNNTDVDYARSSSGPSATEVQNGLQFFPFALDTLKMAVSASVASNAPATLTPAQIVSIYKGDVTNWSQLGGSAGTIVPMIPQAGSGTRSFFVGELKKANDGVDVSLAASVVEVQEHEDDPIKSNPNGVAPFSEGRAGLAGGTLRLTEGFKADRALYNVVRGADLASATVQAMFGEDGFVCSDAARDEIEAAGFKQLATPANNGVCGAATQTSTSDFTLNEGVATTTSLSGSSTKAGTAKLVAAVSGATAPSGTVSFFEGDTALASNVPLVSGQATYTATRVTPGEHGFRAVFTPAEGSQFESSEDEVDVLVKAASVVSESFPAKVKAGKRAEGVVTVALEGIGGTAGGTVVVREGRKVLGEGTLRGGEVTLTLAKLSKGQHALRAIWKGNAGAAGDTVAFRITQK